MIGKKIIIWSIVGTIILNLSFVLAIRIFPQIVYGYAHRAQINLQYPSLSEGESKRRGCFISRYEGENGIEGFLEYRQWYKKGKTGNNSTFLFFILDCRNDTRLFNEVFLEPLDPHRRRHRISFPITNDNEMMHYLVPIPDSLVLKTENASIVLFKVPE